MERAAVHYLPVILIGLLSVLAGPVLVLASSRRPGAVVRNG